MARGIRRLAHRLRYALSGDLHAVRRGFIWPEGNFKRLLLKRTQKIYGLSTFIETGTFEGDTVAYLRRHFDTLVTIEISEQYYRAAAQRFAGDPSVQVVHGDSAVELSEIVSHLDAPAMFWLDGHYSGGKTGGLSSSCPILNELSAIQISRVSGHVIVVDDVSDFSGDEAPVTLADILNAIMRIDSAYKFYFDYDMLFALPGEHQHRDFFRRIVPHYVVR